MHACRQGARVLLAGLALVVAAGCGGSDAKDAAATTPARSSAPSSPAASPTADRGGGAAECDSAKLEIEAGVRVTGYLDTVEVPTCAKALVRTSLTASENDVLSAVAVCGIATTQAAPQGVAAVSVLGADGRELASGTNSADCRATS